MMISKQRFQQIAAYTLLVISLQATAVHSDTVSWDGETSSDWSTGTNWNLQCSGGPFCSQSPPGEDDVAYVGSTATLGSKTAILSENVLSLSGLWIENGNQVQNNGNKLYVQGDIVVSGSNSELIVHSPTFQTTDDLRSNSLRLFNGGHAVVGDPSTGETVSTQHSNVWIDSGSQLSGFGVVETSIIRNDGVIRPLFGTLSIISHSAGGGFDLDGILENGILDVDDGAFLAGNVKLFVQKELSDAFNGTILIGQGDELEIRQPWELGSIPPPSGGVIDMNGNNGTATLSGASVVAEGIGTEINVLTGTADFLAALTLQDQATMDVSANTTTRFLNHATFKNSATFVGGPGYDMVVGAGATVSFAQPIINWDSSSAAAHKTTVEAGAMLVFESNQIDASDNQFDGTVDLQGGDLGVNTATPWVLEGQMMLESTIGNIAQVFGATLVVGNGSNFGTDASIAVSGTTGSNIFSPLRLRDDAEVTIADTASLSLHGLTTLDAGAEITGPGDLFNVGGMVTKDGVDIATRMFSSAALTIGGHNDFGVLTIDHYRQVGEDARLNLEIGDLMADEYDRLIADGDVSIQGILDVDWLGIDPLQPGDEFTIITAANVTGAFEQTFLPPLVAGNSWAIQYNPTSVILKVIADLAADVDQDGDVDGADFLAIQRDYPSLIAQWQIEYGSGVSSTAASQTVPEPSASCLLIFAISLLAGNRRA